MEQLSCIYQIGGAKAFREPVIDFGQDAACLVSLVLSMIGDPTLFQRADMVEAGWRVVAPLLDVWKALPPREFPNYAAGAWGPKEADHILEREGGQWRLRL